MKWIGKVAYQLELPQYMHVFHVSLLRPFYEDKDEPIQSVPKRAPANVMNKSGRRVSKIKEVKVVGFGNRRWKEYLVSWEGQTYLDDTWECVQALLEYDDKIRKFEAKKSDSSW